MDRTETPAFQRARRPEQREQRREEILDTAEALLGEMPISDISLRELSRRVGLSKSNVIRYFESREAVFLELLRRGVDEWLDTLDEAFRPSADAGTPPPVARVLASSLAKRPLLCELWSVLAGVLERNVSVDSVRDFKLAHHDQLARLARLTRTHLPDLTDEDTGELAAACTVTVAGLWPFANPSPTVEEAIQDPRLEQSRVDFAAMLERHLDLLIIGLRHHHHSAAVAHGAQERKRKG